MHKTEIAEALDQRVRDRRTRLGWSQQKLATEAKVSRPIVIDLERGRAVSPAYRQKVEDTLDEAIGKLEAAEALDSEFAGVAWQTVKGAVTRLDERIEEGMDPEDAVTVLYTLLRRVKQEEN